jgi:hypothetical protein
MYVIATALADGDDLSTIGDSGTSTIKNITAPNVNDELFVESFSVAIESGADAAGQILSISLGRIPADAGDTNTTDMQLLLAKVYY